jgi:hypothetical protein
MIPTLLKENQDHIVRPEKLMSSNPSLRMILSDLPSPAEATNESIYNICHGYAQAGNRFTLFEVMRHLFAHDLIRKPFHTFRNHALAVEPDRDRARVSVEPFGGGERDGGVGQ